MVTVHRTLNYGTMLQTFACASLFKEYGFDTQVVDYYREKDYKESDFTDLRSYISARRRISGHNGFVSNFILLGKSILSYRATKRFFMLCSTFLKRNIHTTAPYYSYEDLRSTMPVADYYCAGSDQIWNTDYNGGINPFYFLEFAGDKPNKFSFCSSIGKTELGAKEKKVIKEQLSSFKAISVREKSAKELLDSLGIKATDLIDPTLIRDSAFWSKMCSKRLITQPYLLIYKLKSNDTIDKIATQIAKEKGLKIVRVSFDDIHGIRGETSFVLPKISEFLSLIKYADYVVTNSFHGTCFSINFNRQFLAVPREKYNTRIENILAKLNAIERLYSTDKSIKDICSHCDYIRINEKLEQERKIAKQWLREVLI